MPQPNSVPILRTSERRTFKRCQWRWWMSYREGMKPVGAESTPLWFGTGIHLGLAEWYIPGVKRGIHPAETFAKYAGDALTSVKVADATEERVAQYEDGKELGIILLEEYVRHWGHDEKWHFIQAEQTFSVDVPWPGNDRQQLYEVDENTGLLVEYKGTYDGVYRDLETGLIELLETKSAKAVQTTHLTLDDQAGSYYAVATHTLRKDGLIGPKESIKGINYNFLRKAMPDERPKDAEGYATNKPVKEHYLAALPEAHPKDKLEDLKKLAEISGVEVLGDRSKTQPLPLFTRYMVNRTTAERKSQLSRIQDEAVQMQALRDHILPLTKNPNRDCSWDCDFFDMCELHERGGDWETLKRVGFRRQDPYADHRKSAED